MIHVIKDVVINPITGHPKVKVIKIVETEYDVFDFLKDPKNLKLFKGDVKVDKVIL